MEKKNDKKLSLIADLQGVKLRIGKVKNEKQKIKFNQKFIFDNKNALGNSQRVNFPYPKIIKKLKKGNKILIDDGKYLFSVIGKKGNSVITKCRTQNCILKSKKSFHVPNIHITFDKLTKKIRKILKLQ